MSRLGLTGLVCLILTASCAVNLTTDGSGGTTTPSRPQARRSAPPPPPPPPKPAAPAPPPPTPVTPTPRPAPAPAPAPAPNQNTAVRPDSLHNRALGDLINVQKVQAIKLRNPKNCGFMEMSPGNWIHMDCTKYTASTKAIAHLSARKHKLVSAHKTFYKPLRLMGVVQNNKNLQNLIIKGGGASGGKPAGVGAGAPAVAPAAGGPAQVADSFPGTVDHRSDNTEGPIKNQGGVGSCTAHSLSAALDNAAIRAGNLKPGDRDGMVSPLHVWSRYGLPNMGAAADGNIAQPVALYKQWPQSDKEACMLFSDNGSYAQDCAEAYGVTPGSWRKDPGVMGKYNAAQAAGVYKIASIEKLQVEPPNMEELIGILAGGSDIWSAFLIDGSKWNNGAMKSAVIPDWGEPSGGHAVVISGYRDTPSGKQFLIHNSWGESWGDKGYAWVSQNMVNKNLYYAYKVKITNGVRKEDLTDDDCAPDELVDIGSGLCAVMCADDSRPNNGCKK